MIFVQDALNHGNEAIIRQFAPSRLDCAPLIFQREKIVKTSTRIQRTKTIIEKTFVAAIEKENGAIFSDSGKYRYFLWRRWSNSAPVIFICLNPSIADDNRYDPTSKRCVNFAVSWGFGALYLVNLFALVSRNSNKLCKDKDPLGYENDIWLSALAKEPYLAVAAWGNKGSYLNRSTKINQLFPNLHMLKMNKSGEPCHPLYLSKDLRPTPLNAEKE